jgi:hypothetical protein
MHPTPSAADAHRHMCRRTWQQMAQQLPLSAPAPNHTRTMRPGQLLAKADLDDALPAANSRTTWANKWRTTCRNRSLVLRMVCLPASCLTMAPSQCVPAALLTGMQPIEPAYTAHTTCSWPASCWPRLTFMNA